MSRPDTTEDDLLWKAFSWFKEFLQTTFFPDPPMPTETLLSCRTVKSRQDSFFFMGKSPYRLDGSIIAQLRKTIYHGTARRGRESRPEECQRAKNRPAWNHPKHAVRKGGAAVFWGADLRAE